MNTNTSVGQVEFENINQLLNSAINEKLTDSKVYNDANVVIIPAHTSGVYMVDKNRFGYEGEEMNYLEALNKVQNEDNVLLYLGNNKFIRNF